MPTFGLNIPKRGMFAFRQAHWDKAEEYHSLILSNSLPTSEVTVLCITYTYELLANLIQTDK